MRRVIAVIVCIFLLATGVSAANSAPAVSTTAVVAENGSCSVQVRMSVRLDEPASDLGFPLGSGISQVTLNGAPAQLTQSGGVTSIRLKHLDGQTGTFDLDIRFQINSVVHTDEDGDRIIRVPLLFGFPYPVEAMSFSVTMPGAFNTVPTFFSGYHGQDIERSMTSSVQSTVISGQINTALKDSETLYMELEAPEGMFHLGQTFGGSVAFDTMAMIVCAVLAMVLWLLRLSRLPSFAPRRSTPPDGISAGSVGCYLVRKGADLSLMVVSWAQLGYLIIQMDENGRVYLHKKMNMGNERNAFERRIFRNLFGRSQLLDTSSYRYAKLQEKTAQISRRYSTGYRSRAVDTVFFRMIASGVGLFAAVAMVDSVVTSHTWRTVLMALGGIFGTVASWQMQEGMFSIHLRDKAPLKTCGVLCLLVLAAGILSGNGILALATVLWSLFAGLAAAYSGRRSENGLRIYNEILGLRRHLRKVSHEELARIHRSNPDYYYELAPYALALGVDKQFAQRYGNLKNPACTWLVTLIEARTAPEWYSLLREAVQAMEREHKKTLWDKLFHKK